MDKIVGVLLSGPPCISEDLHCHWLSAAVERRHTWTSYLLSGLWCAGCVVAGRRRQCRVVVQDYIRWNRHCTLVGQAYIRSPVAGSRQGRLPASSVASNIVCDEAGRFERGHDRFAVSPARTRRDFASPALPGLLVGRWVGAAGVAR